VQNFLGIWVTYPGSPTMVCPHSTPFNGVCAADTDCGDSTDCSNAIGRPPRGASAILGGTAPLLWSVAVAGLVTEAGAPFNGSWLLTLREGVDLHCVWDNGGDGHTTPRVELRYDSIRASEWQLTLLHRACRVQYAKPATEWQWLNVNELSLVPRESGPADWAPPSLRVVPV
jgi:hypothetical protein